MRFAYNLCDIGFRNAPLHVNSRQYPGTYKSIIAFDEIERRFCFAFIRNQDNPFPEKGSDKGIHQANIQCRHEEIFRSPDIWNSFKFRWTRHRDIGFSLSSQKTGAFPSAIAPLFYIETLYTSSLVPYRFISFIIHWFCELKSHPWECERFFPDFDRSFLSDFSKSF